MTRRRSLRLWPATATADARRLVVARAVRGFADGFVSVTLADYLAARDFSAFEVSAIVTATLLGSALLTLAVGLLGHRAALRRLLYAATALMVATGVGFAGLTTFWPLLLVAVVGTLNPSAGDVSVFLPLEQTLLAATVRDRDRTALYARHNLAGLFAAAFGALAAALPVALAAWLDWDRVDVQRASFLGYAAGGLALWLLYRGLSPALGAGDPQTTSTPLREARRLVYQLAALFSLDSFGGGLVTQALLVLWLFQRHGLSLEVAGTVFFVSGLLAAGSQLGSAPLARRIGLIRTMAFTHIPANVFLILAAVAPSAPLAVAMLLARMVFSAMDVPARQSYVMAVVPPAERAAAASVTNVPRSLVAAAAPLLAGYLLTISTFGWPLVLGGAVKISYDLLLLAGFRGRRPPEEVAPPRAARDPA